MHKVGILGTPVSGNRGVLALGASLVDLCYSSSEASVVLFLGHCNSQPRTFQVRGQSRVIPVVNYRLSLRARPCDHLIWIVLACLLYRCMPLGFLRRFLSRVTPWIAALESVDFAGDVRGGDSFSDIYGLKGFLGGFLEAWTVLLIKGTMVQFPQTYGPYKSPLARLLARYLLRRSNVIIARDEESQQLAQELTGPRHDVWLSPDVAFSLEAVKPERIEFDPPLLPSSGLSTLNSQPPVPLARRSTSVIGLNVSGLLFNGGYTRDNMFGLKLDYPGFLPSLITALLSEHSGELWLIPHTYGRNSNSVEDDPMSCRQVRAALSPDLQKRVRLLTGEYNCHELKHMIGKCDFFIGARMHACIAALSQGVPCVGVAYSKKFAGVFKTVGMEEWVVDARSISSDVAVDRVMELYRKRSEVRDSLATRAQAARDGLHRVFSDLSASVTGASTPRRRRAEPLVHRNTDPSSEALAKEETPARRPT